jgi:hypothetical protein
MGTNNAVIQGSTVVCGLTGPNGEIKAQELSKTAASEWIESSLGEECWIQLKILSWFDKPPLRNARCLAYRVEVKTTPE